MVEFIEFINEEGSRVAVVPSQVNYLEDAGETTFIITAGCRGLGVRATLAEVMRKLRHST